jgi:pentatricopeptide repeat protein
VIDCSKDGNLPDEWVVMNRRSTSKTNTEDLSSYHNLIARYYYERNYEEVFRTFDNLKVHGLSLNASIYNFVLLALVAVSQFNRALVMFDEMKHSNVQPDSLTYDIIIRVFFPS